MCHHKTCPSSLFMTWCPLLLILLISWYSYQGGAHFLSHVFDPFLISSATFTVGVHSTGKKKDRSTSFWRWVSPRTPKLSIRELVFGFCLKNFLIIYTNKVDESIKEKSTLSWIQIILISLCNIMWDIRSIINVIRQSSHSANKIIKDKI